MANLPVLSFADAPVALINSVTGNVFISSNEQKTTRPMRVARAGEHIYDFEEVITEEGGQATLTDYFDHQFHLSGSGHLKFFNKSIELKNGYFWIKSFSQSTQPFMIQTANAQAHYTNAEGIISFDGVSGKTQLLVIKGRFDFANLIQSELVTEVDEGQFSYIHNEYEDGSPRKPTPIGFGSYKKITSLFKKMDAREKIAESNVIANNTVNNRKVDRQRLPASNHLKPVNKSELIKEIAGGGHEITQKNNYSGDIIYRRDDREEKKAQEKELLNYYEQKINRLAKSKKQKFTPSFEKKSQVQMNVYGASYKTNRAKTARKIASSTQARKQQRGKVVEARSPASLGGMIPVIKASPKFESALTKEYKQQMRHSQERNQLINELKTYDQDYKRRY